MLCEEKGAKLRIVPVDERGEVGAFELSDRTKLVAIAHISNALGTVLPVREIVEQAHRRGVPVLLDGAQAIPHMKVDVRELDCDFYVFSSHKLYGPTGIGILYGKAELLDAMPPYQGGGDMIRSVTFEKTTYNTLPYKFEAGTPDIAGVVGLGAAIDYVNEIGLENMAAQEADLLEYATAALSKIDGVRIIGTAPHKAAGDFVRARRRASARCRHHSRPAGYRRAHRPSLRAAGDGSLRHSRHHPRLFRVLQHPRRRGRAGPRN